MSSSVLGRAIFGRMIFGRVRSAVSASVPDAPSDRTFRIPKGTKSFFGYKTPAEILNYCFDWSSEISTDLIDTSVWSSSDQSINFILSDITTTKNKTRLLLSGGVAGNAYIITNTVVLKSGVTQQASFLLYVNIYNT